MTIRVVSAIVFILFSWCWLYFFQNDLLAMAQHVLSHGLTHYNRFIGATGITPMWHLPIELKRRFPALPVLCDPSHMGGRRDLIAPVSQQAMDLGFDGLMIEAHCNPDCAWSDAKQQVLPEVLDFILVRLVIRDSVEATESISQLRKQIDELDNHLMDVLTKRMRISREIAEYKKLHNMTVVQTTRYSEILDKRGAQGALCGMNPDFVKTVYEAIHSESVRQQIEIMNK